MKHRLVCMGDSFSQGFKNGAVFETNLSYPAIIAWEMGLSENEFSYPKFSGKGGLPINMEYLLWRIENQIARDKKVDWYDTPLAGMFLREWMDEIEEYWEQGPGTKPVNYGGIYHNLSVWGFEIQDAYQVTAGMCREIVDSPLDSLVFQRPKSAMYRTALRVLNPSLKKNEMHSTQIKRVAELALSEGIENLIVSLGSGNVLKTVTKLALTSSSEADMNQIIPEKRIATLYTPDHFNIMLSRLMKEIEEINQKEIRIRHIFWPTIPPVTIGPITKGLYGRLTSPSGLGRSPFGTEDHTSWYRRYFNYYSRPWVTDKLFNPATDSRLTGQHMVLIDQTIAEYNRLIREKVDAHNEEMRTKGRDENWFLVDLAFVMEKLAYRRYEEDPTVPPPPGWYPYEFPSILKPLKINTHFLKAKKGYRVDGGFFSLDGIHPTTIGNGIIAQEFVRMMQKAGVKFYERDCMTERVDRVRVNFNRLISLDTLCNRLPHSMEDIWEKTCEGSPALELFQRALAWLT